MALSLLEFVVPLLSSWGQLIDRLPTTRPLYSQCCYYKTKWQRKKFGCNNNAFLLFSLSLSPSLTLFAVYPSFPCTSISGMLQEQKPNAGVAPARQPTIKSMLVSQKFYCPLQFRLPSHLAREKERERPPHWKWHKGRNRSNCPSDGHLLLYMYICIYLAIAQHIHIHEPLIYQRR